MLFNSLEFIFLFLPATFIVYFALSRFRLIFAAKLWLVFASLFFYSWWDVRYLPVILVSIAVNYAIGGLLALTVDRYSFFIQRKAVLILGIVFNLALLGYYKYADFFILNLNVLFHTQISLLKLSLPLGISFFTFTQIVYLSDLYRRNTTENHPENYSLFVAFFPHLLAGPIVHHSVVMPQFKSVRNQIIQSKNVFIGLFYFIAGLFQKVVIADYVAVIANQSFSNSAKLSLVESWVGVTAYALQIYFDFAGYSNMAIGLARLFNIRFPSNFNSPYQAVSIIDFWRRWHITLSLFLRDYLYIPLGGNRKGELNRCVNIFVTMLLGGLWHGANWTFVLWGAYHGFLIVLNHGLEKLKFWRFPRPIAVVTTFILACAGWVLFRSPDLSHAAQMLRGLVGFQGIRFHDFPYFWNYDILVLGGLCLVVWCLPNIDFWSKKARPDLFWLCIYISAFIASVLFLNRDSVFLYFQF